MKGLKLDTVSSPDLISESRLKGCLCAVVDVLRATSTVVVALAGGALEIRPCLDAAEVRRHAAKMPPGVAYLLGGEEGGLRVRGFDLGNSPLEYLAADVVSGKVIFLSTTNGTKAIRATHRASGLPVYVGSLLNLSAVSSAMTERAVDGSVSGLAVVCSGLKGGFSEEDLFCAGLIIDRLEGAGLDLDLSKDASAAAEFAANCKDQPLRVLAESEHGRYLKSIGFYGDIEFASQLDQYNVVPVFEGESIVLS